MMMIQSLNFCTELWGDALRALYSSIAQMTIDQVKVKLWGHSTLFFFLFSGLRCVPWWFPFYHYQNFLLWQAQKSEFQ